MGYFGCSSFRHPAPLSSQIWITDTLMTSKCHDCSVFSFPNVGKTYPQYWGLENISSRWGKQVVGFFYPFSPLKWYFFPLISISSNNTFLEGEMRNPESSKNSSSRKIKLEGKSVWSNINIILSRYKVRGFDFGVGSDYFLQKCFIIFCRISNFSRYLKFSWGLVERVFFSFLIFKWF